MAEVANIQYYVSPIADPIAPEKLNKKLLRLTKKFVASKKAKRGVKEVVKALRKGSKGLVVLAADISPVDVLSHIPGICEKKNVPYIWVRSRMELGTAAQTKKPTSVVLLTTPAENDKLSTKFSSMESKLRSLNPYL